MGTTTPGWGLRGGSMGMRRLLTVLPIVLFSGLFGFFLWETYFVHNSPGYTPFEHGQWITSSELNGDVFYFRKRFNLSDNIKNAWLLVSASDGFKAYLNGEAVGVADLDSWYPVGIYDVTDRVNVGANELAVRVERRSFAGSTKVAVELGYEDTYGNRHYVVSDQTWRVSNKEERDSVSGFMWNDLKFNDGGWASAEVLGRPKGLWLEIDPRIYTTSADEQWFWGGEQKEISCRAEMYIPKRPRTAWVRLASRGGDRFLVNKSRVDVEEGILGTEAVPADVLKIYDIGSFLRRGKNTILISNYAQGPERGLYVDGIIEGDGWSRTLNEDNFRCFYVGGSTPLKICKGDPGWVSIRNKIIKQDIYIPIGLSLLSYSTLVLIFCISLVVFIGFTVVFSIITPLSFYSLSRAYVIPSLFLIFIYILRYDVRFYLSFPFQWKFLIISVCLLFLLWLVSPLINRVEIRTIPKWVYTLTFILILAMGAFLRFKGVDQEPLYWDEAQMTFKAQGVLDHGYPSLKLAPELPTRYVPTSELALYLQALSFVVFGKSEFSLRLPMVLFGVLTIPLLYYFGRMIGGERVGLLSAAICSLLPSAIGMSDFGRYPSQVAFFGFLTAFIAFVYLKTDRARYPYLFALSFLLTYFSWEGSILMVLPLLLSCLTMWKKERIFKDILIFVLIVTPVIGTQLVIKFLQASSIGSFLFGPGISEITPSLMFLSPVYDPFFYVKYFFFIEGHQFLSILFFAGIPLVFIKFRSYRDLLFLYILPLGVPLIMSNILEIASYRYAYYMVPFLILCACRVFFVFLDYLGYTKENKSLSTINSVFASIMLIVVSSGLFLNLKNFPQITEDIKTDQSLRYSPQTDEASEFIKASAESGDIIVSFQPHLLGYYLGKDRVNYFFESILGQSVYIVPRKPDFIFVHRVTGTPAILSLNELRRVIGAGRRRVWLVATPGSPDRLDNDSKEFINENRRVVFERYITRIYLIGGD